MFRPIKPSSGEVVTEVQGCWLVLSPTRKEASYSDRRFWFWYILFIIIIGGILLLFIYITRLASKEIFPPSIKIHREVGRAKDLSAPLYEKKSFGWWWSYWPKYVANFCKIRTDFITKVLVYNWIVVRLIDARGNNRMPSPAIVINLKCVLFNDTVNCWDYVASVLDESMSMEHRWNDIDRKKTEGLGEKNPIATSSTKKSHKKDLVLKVDLRGWRPGANSFNHGTGHLNTHSNNIWLQTGVYKAAFQGDLLYHSACSGVLRKIGQ